MKKIWDFTKTLFEEYIKDDAFRKGAALAYYTVFSIGPIILLVVSLTSIFLGKEAVNDEIFVQLEDLVGAEASAQIQQVVQNTYKSGNSIIATIIGVVTLILSATAVFNEMQVSLNTIWGIKSKPKNGIWGFIFARVLSFGVVASMGFVMLVSLVINSLIAAFNETITQTFSEVTTIIVEITNFSVSILLTALLFAAIYKILPDAKVRWRDVALGSIFTAILFTIGKYAIGYYLGTSAVGSTYGAAGSIVILLLWTYYTSQILFLGAEFTYVWAKRKGHEIRPSPHAVRVKRIEVEEE